MEIKYCYPDANPRHPTEKYVKRFIINEGYNVDIDVIRTDTVDTTFVLEQLFDIITELDSRDSCNTCIMPVLMGMSWSDLCDEAIRLLNRIK